jgi:hypothetical protein
LRGKRNGKNNKRTGTSRKMIRGTHTILSWAGGLVFLSSLFRRKRIIFLLRREFCFVLVRDGEYQREREREAGACSVLSTYAATVLFATYTNCIFSPLYTGD